MFRLRFRLCGHSTALRYNPPEYVDEVVRIVPQTSLCPLKLFQLVYTLQ